MARAERELDITDLGVFAEPQDDEEFVAEDDVREEVDITEVFDADDPVTGEIDLDAPAHYRDRERALTDRDREMLAFERQWWRHPGSKEQAIKERFGMSPTRYYQVLNALLDVPAALAFDPLVVGRLQRLRTSRRGARAGR
ncbi:MAG TPA: DUF3263 domain-containing protein [Micromonosporaceae bacterium]|nr:DUF3263 domain-containing protein [Micromonosporaceae bacterium]